MWNLIPQPGNEATHNSSARIVTVGVGLKRADCDCGGGAVYLRGGTCTVKKAAGGIFEIVEEHFCLTRPCYSYNSRVVRD